MAATYNILDTAVQGNQQVKTVQMFFDTSYPTGGYTLTPAMLGLSKVTFATPALAIGFATNTLAFAVIWNNVTNKVQVYWTGGTVGTAFAEVTAATNLTAAILACNLQFQGF